MGGRRGAETRRKEKQKQMQDGKKKSERNLQERSFFLSCTRFFFLSRTTTISWSSSFALLLSLSNGFSLSFLCDSGLERGKVNCDNCEQLLLLISFICTYGFVQGWTGAPSFSLFAFLSFLFFSQTQADFSF